MEERKELVHFLLEISVVKVASVDTPDADQERNQLAEEPRTRHQKEEKIEDSPAIKQKIITRGQLTSV